jgi:hypothetical protein
MSLSRLNRKLRAGNGKKDSDSRALTKMTDKIATTDIDYVGRSSPGLAGRISPLVYCFQLSQREEQIVLHFIRSGVKPVAFAPAAIC